MLNEWARKIKSWYKDNENEIVWVAVVLFATGVGFGAGRVAIFNSNKTPIEINPPASNLGANAISSLNSSRDEAAAETENNSITQITDKEPVIMEQSPKIYVASKNGSVFYLPSCGGVRLIKEANKIWFSSKEEASRAGYKPAANCKGL